MKFTFAAAVAGLAVIVDAKASFTNLVFTLQAGVPFNLTWSGGSAPYQIVLDNGPSSNLKDFKTLTTTSDMSYVFTPSSSLPSDRYAFKIIDASGEPNFSEQWKFQGSASASETTVSAAEANTSAPTPSASMSSTALRFNSTAATSSGPSEASKVATKTGFAGASSTSPITNINAGERVASPIALLMVAAAGLIFFN